MYLKENQIVMVSKNTSGLRKSKHINLKDWLAQSTFTAVVESVSGRQVCIRKVYTGQSKTHGNIEELQVINLDTEDYSFSPVKAPQLEFKSQRIRAYV